MEVYKNGSATGVYAIIGGSTATEQYAYTYAGAVTFATGDLLDLRDSASGAPNNRESWCTMFLQFD